MPEAHGLENTRAVRKVYFARSASSAVSQLRKGRVVSAADSFGALCAWRGYDKKYRVEAMRWLRTVDKREFTSLKAVNDWWAKWLKKIERAGA